MTVTPYEKRYVQVFSEPLRGLTAPPVAEGVNPATGAASTDVNDQIRALCAGLPHGDYITVRTYLEHDGPVSNVVRVTVAAGQVTQIRPADSDL